MLLGERQDDVESITGGVESVLSSSEFAEVGAQVVERRGEVRQERIWSCLSELSVVVYCVLASL